jgi:hypothetical protein
MAVIRAMPFMLQWPQWRDEVVGRQEEKKGETAVQRRRRREWADRRMAEFMERHSQSGEYTDAEGVMCQVRRYGTSRQDIVLCCTCVS